jgi:hypothetical protein
VTAPRLNRSALRTDLAAQVVEVEKDLKDQLDRGELPTELADLKAAHRAATVARRTVADFDDWPPGEVTQSAVPGCWARCSSAGARTTS